MKKKKKKHTSLSFKSEKYQLMLLKKDSFFSKFSINLASQSSLPLRLILMSKNER